MSIYQEFVEQRHSHSMELGLGNKSEGGATPLCSDLFQLLLPMHLIFSDGEIGKRHLTTLRKNLVFIRQGSSGPSM